MFFAIFLELYSNSSYNKGRGVFAIIRYLSIEHYDENTAIQILKMKYELQTKNLNL